jgi:Family of unknown function (DUF5683)
LKLRLILLLVIFLLINNFSSAQDTLRSEVDSIPRVKDHSPLFAGLASAILPGTGQVYNRKYWKVPIVYAGLATAGYFIYYNGKVYFTIRNNLNSRVALDSVPQPRFLIVNLLFSNTNEDLNLRSDAELLVLQDEYRKYFTLSLIAGGAVYLLNVLDAVVDAHLFHFDVSDDLSLDVHPQMFSAYHGRPAPGFSMFLTIK